MAGISNPVIMKRIVLIMAALLFVNAASAFQVDFSKDGDEKVFELFHNVMQMPDQGMMALPERVETRTLPIEAGKKYKLQMTAQVDGDFVVEENDRAHIETLRSRQDIPRSTYEVRFQNSQGEDVPNLGGRKSATTGFFLTKNAYPYVMVFYVPEGATSLKVTFLSKDRTIHLSSLQLAEETEEKAVNINPDFRYGELNYCGWEPTQDGRLYKLSDGKLALNTGLASYSSFFPLTSQKTYRASIIGEGSSNVSIDYFGKDGKLLVRDRPLGYPKPEGVQREFMAPEGTVMGRLAFPRPQMLREVRIEEVK